MHSNFMNSFSDTNSAISYSNLISPLILNAIIPEITMQRRRNESVYSLLLVHLMDLCLQRKIKLSHLERMENASDWESLSANAKVNAKTIHRLSESPKKHKRLPMGYVNRLHIV